MDVQGDDVSADLRLRRHHGRLLHLLPVGSQVGQPQVVVDKLEAATHTHKDHDQHDVSGNSRDAPRVLSPFPCAQVHHDEALVLVGVDVVKHADGGTFELVVNVFSRVFPGDVKQGLSHIKLQLKKETGTRDIFECSLGQKLVEIKSILTP